MPTSRLPDHPAVAERTTTILDALGVGAARR